MSLKNLNELSMRLKQNYYENFVNTEIEFTERQKELLTQCLFDDNKRIVFKKYTSEITSATEQKIYMPNQWFILASFFVEYVAELEKYKNILIGISADYHTVASGAKFMDYIKECKKLTPDQLDEGLTNRLQIALDTTSDVEYMIKFLTSYDWWGGSKTIDRGDYFVSPVLNMLNVINVNHSIIPNLTYKYTKFNEIYQELKSLQSFRRTEDIVELPTTVAKGGINKIYYGGPGTGKSFKIDRNFTNIQRVVFYPDYMYCDFVGAYKPVPLYTDSGSTLKYGNGENASEVVGMPVIDYRFVPGPFIQSIVKALLHPTEMYTLVIEEINRGNAASIFGSMFQLLDRDENGKSEYPIDMDQDLLLYIGSVEGLDAISSYGKLYIPANLNIIATMNSADQGVYVLDSAFKRRWLFEYTKVDNENIPHGNYLISYAGDTVRWSCFISSLNAKLVSLAIDEDRLIGPFFIKPTEITNIENIKAKLFLYLWDDVVRHKRNLFFDESINSYSKLLEMYDANVDVFGIYEDIKELERASSYDNQDDDQYEQPQFAAESSGDF